MLDSTLALAFGGGILGGLAAYAMLKEKERLATDAENALRRAGCTWSPVTPEDRSHPTTVVFSKNTRRSFARSNGRRAAIRFPSALVCATPDDKVCVERAIAAGMLAVTGPVK